MKLLSVPFAAQAQILNSQEGSARLPARKVHNQTRGEIYLRPIAVIKPAFSTGMPGTDIGEKGSLVDTYA